MGRYASGQWRNLTGNLWRLLGFCVLAIGMQVQAADTRNLSSSERGRRIALVIGNDGYQRLTPLRNARADATAIAHALEASGFQVILRRDVDLRGIKEAVRNLKNQVDGGDQVVFFFSGHGVQLGTANYLLPVDIAGQSEDQVADDALPLQRVLDDLSERKAALTLAIIDACRTNPFKGAGRAIGGRGLAPVVAATGQMVLYSAGTGQEALDRLDDSDKDPNGVFTRVLLKEMRKPGESVDQVMKNVRAEVVRLAKSVGREQVPALYDQVIGTFYFVEPPRREAVAPPPAPTAAPTLPALLQSGSDVEQQLWDAVKGSRDPDDYRNYLKQYPKGMYAAVAQQMIKKLSAAAAAAPVIAPPAVSAPAPSRPIVASTAPTLTSPIAGALPPGVGSVFHDCPGCPDMVVLQGGTFDMGSAAGEMGRDIHEGPVHHVQIASFALGKTHVTRGQFAAFVNETGYAAKSNCYPLVRHEPVASWRNPGFDQDDNHPVVCISWKDASAYTRWLSARTGRSYRLPTEAEWEYAARAGTRTSRFWGDNPDQACIYANVADSTMVSQLMSAGYAGLNSAQSAQGWAHSCTDGYAYTAPVASFKPNAWGLYDMLGEALQWTQDCPGSDSRFGVPNDYTQAPINGSAWISASCDSRVMRGGSWWSAPLQVRAAARTLSSTDSDVRFSNWGFRVARSLP